MKTVVIVIPESTLHALHPPTGRACNDLLESAAFWAIVNGEGAHIVKSRCSGLGRSDPGETATRNVSTKQAMDIAELNTSMMAPPKPRVQFSEPAVQDVYEQVILHYLPSEYAAGARSYCVGEVDSLMGRSDLFCKGYREARADPRYQVLRELGLAFRKAKS